MSKKKKTISKSKRQPKAKHQLDPLIKGCTKHPSKLWVVPDEKSLDSKFMDVFEGDCIDVLEAAPMFIMAKEYEEEGLGYKGVMHWEKHHKDIDGPANFTRIRFLIRTYTDLKRLRRYIASKPTRFWIYGLAIVEIWEALTKENSKGSWKDRPKCYRRTSDTKGPPSILKDRRCNWLMLDTDENHNKLKEITATAAAVKKAISRQERDLHHLFKTRNMVFIPSNGFGIPDHEDGIQRPKAHVFMRLKETLYLTEIEAFIENINALQEDDDVVFENPSKEPIKFDVSVYRPAQPIYEDLPQFVKGQEIKSVLTMDRYFHQGAKTPLFDPEPFREMMVVQIKKHYKRSTMTVPQNVLWFGIVYWLSNNVCKGVKDKDGDTQMEGEPLLRGLETNPQTGEIEVIHVLCYLDYEHSGANTANSCSFMLNNQQPAFVCQHTNTHENEDTREMMRKEFVFLSEQGLPDYLNPHADPLILMQHVPAIQLRNKSTTDWRIGDVQSNYIYIKKSENVYSIYDKDFLSIGSISMMHQKTYASKEAKSAGDKPLGGRAALFTTKGFAGCRVASSERFDPGNNELLIEHDGLEYLNAFRGFTIQPIEGDTSAFHEHIKLLLPDEIEAAAFTDYLGHLIQVPGERPSWSPVHLSHQQGLGRGALNTLMSRLVSPYTAPVSPEELLHSTFNPWLKNTIWLGIEETQTDSQGTKYKSSKRDAAKLKELITAETVNINIKNVGHYLNYSIYSRFFFMTNSIDALPIDTSDRRFWVIGPNDATYLPREPEYYDRFWEQIKDPLFQSAVMHDLLHRDLSIFTPHYLPFPTALKDEMRKAGQSNEQRALGYIMSRSDICPFMTQKKIIKLITDYGYYHNIQMSHSDVLSVIAGLPKYNKGDPIKIGGVTRRLKIVRDAEEAIQLREYSPQDIRDLHNKLGGISIGWLSESD